MEVDHEPTVWCSQCETKPRNRPRGSEGGSIRWLELMEIEVTGVVGGQKRGYRKRETAEGRKCWLLRRWISWFVIEIVLMSHRAHEEQCAVDTANEVRTLLLKDGCLLEVDNHILYSPLPCRVPLPGFKPFHFCVSQYDEKDRLLLRNLCFTLGARFGEKLTRKVTHLLCKFTNGPKYEAACKWGIQSVTCEWIYECVKRNDIVAPGPFVPKEVTSQDREAGLCTMSQYPTQATRMISGDNSSQFPSESNDLRTIRTEAIGRSHSSKKEAKVSTFSCKRAKLLEDDSDKGLQSSGLNQSDPIGRIISSGNNILQNTGEVSHAVPDVAAAIEDLLEQTSKLFSVCSIGDKDHADPHSSFGLSEHWINSRTDKKDDICNPSGDVNAGMYDGFSETQTESQVVGYEEDLSGRQMIIDRVRTRSSLT
ncbi:transcription coactivator [Actinidia rufa]|uniref:Transcription coactivator n=1 Tax=Actinidia rufa TaxID=165716 RepID=A0A7J0FCX7_9ERIC|nr:transcription coactivator [Actinidia rufa]